MFDRDLSIAEDFDPVTYDQWRQVVEKDLKGAPFEKKLISQTYEGLQIKPVYTADDWSAEGDPSGFAGFDPRTRGSSPLGPATCGWDIRQEHAHPDLKAANKAILTDLERGVNSLQLRFDVAARSGRDGHADEQTAGIDGLMVYNAEQLERLLGGVHLEMAGIGLEAGAAFGPAAALLAAVWQNNNLRPEQCWGAFNADPLSVLARDGELPYSLDQGMKQLGELAAWTAERYPKVMAVRVGTAPYHHAGATAVQDLAISMATGVAYLRAMERVGLDVNTASGQLLFNYGLGTNFFLAMAKLRAARKLWARVIEACGGDEAARRMTMHVKTSKRVVTARDPWVNMLRNTACCFAGAVAGADVITTSPFDAAIGLPNDASRRIARNTQVILLEESRLNRVVDPAGGGWFVESMTDELAEKAWAMFQEIESRGGMAEALTRGWIADQIESAFAPRLANIARRKDAVTGVSEYPNLTEASVERESPDLRKLRGAAAAELADRTGDVRAESLSAAVEAAADGATIGQLARAMWKDGDGVTIAPLTPNPYARPFEELRDASDLTLAETGQRPKVFLANMGPIAHHTARATFSKNFFEAGGFAVESNNGFDRADAAAEAFRQSGANIAVICSSDKLYPQFVPHVAPGLKQAGARTVILAGHPGDQEAAYREAGVDRFIYIKVDVLETLRDLLREEGVID